MGKKLFFGVFLSLVLASAAFAFIAFPSQPKEDYSNSVPIQYNSQVCIYKNGGLVSCDHNLLYNSGKNMTRDALFNGGAGKVINISLCNATAGCGTPASTSDEGYTGFNSCGLSAGEGTATINKVSPGNWSIQKTFTSSCDGLSTNATRLGNATMNQSGVGLLVDGLFAGNTFTLVNMNNADQLTVNWTIWIS